MSLKTFAPLHFCATPAAAQAFGYRLPEIAREAFLEIGRTGRGYALHHHQFRLESGELVAVAARVKASGVVEVDIDLGQPGLPMRTFTKDDAARAWRNRR